MNSKDKCNCNLLYKMFIPHFFSHHFLYYWDYISSKKAILNTDVSSLIIVVSATWKILGASNTSKVWVSSSAAFLTNRPFPLSGGKKVILVKIIEGYLLAGFQWLCGVNGQTCIPRQYHFALFLLSMKVKGLMTLKKWPVLQEVIKAATLKYSPSAPSSLIPVMIMVRNGFIFIMLETKLFNSLSNIIKND